MLLLLLSITERLNLRPEAILAQESMQGQRRKKRCESGELSRRGIFYCTYLEYTQCSKTTYPSVSERRTQMEVLGLLPPACTQVETPITLVIGGFPIFLPPHIPDRFQHAQVYTMHRTNTSSLHLSISLPPLLANWEWPPVLGQVRSGKSPG